ncbi:MAG TPA: hypothetical protein VMV79_04135 [Alphaproteobacteria bacterium]|nr:hypothetical protein [Alphaproteobacteria bacterium]
MKRSALLIGFALMLALGACSSSSSEQKEEKIKTEQNNAAANAMADREYKNGKPICPKVAVIHELQIVRDYGREKPDPSQLVAAARIMGVTGSCAYEDKGIDVTFTADMVAGRGPRLGGDSAEFPFFVAVVDPTQDILNKDQMTATFRFEDGKKRAPHQESLHVFIPLAKKDDASGPDYQVLIGFQLSEEQLKEVRKHENGGSPPASAAH